MPRFFVESGPTDGENIVLTGDNARHLAYSLRARVGDNVYVCDRDGTEYECSVDSFTQDSVVCRVISSGRPSTEPPYRAVLCQAIPKLDKMDYIIQKAVELGVYKVIPFESENCVAKVKPEAAERKTERWNKISQSAAEQCGRGMLPQVCAPVTFDKALCRDGTKLFCYERGGVDLREALSRFDGEQICFMIGPEGGFSEREANEAIDAGWTPVSLGSRILRTETASLYFLSALLYEKDKKTEYERRTL